EFLKLNVSYLPGAFKIPTMLKPQTTDTILMIRPSWFSFNTETSGTNIFQHETIAGRTENIHEKALKEFDDFVYTLRDHKMYVIVLQDPGAPLTPDSIFPNNWISFDDDRIFLYPMLAANRRQERRPAWINFFRKEFHYHHVTDFSGYEERGQFLEGTGSLVFDHKNRVVYANLSSRTNEALVREVAQEMNYKPVSFSARDMSGRDIYHTNVIMAIGIETAIICAEVIHSKMERENVLRHLSANHHVVEISYNQM